MTREIEFPKNFIPKFSLTLDINALGNYDGIVTELDLWRVIGINENTSQDIIMSAMVNAHDVIALSTDLDQIFTTAPDDLATISSNDPVISSDVNIDWNVWLNGVIIDSGTQALVAGVLTLTFSSGDTGEYLIEIKRQGATEYETGYIEIEVLDHA